MWRDDRLELADDGSKPSVSLSSSNIQSQASNLRHSVKKRDNGEKMVSRKGKVLSRSGISQGKSKPAAESVNSRAEFEGGAPLPSKVHGFTMKEDEEEGSRFNGVWSKEEPGTFRSGKRKRAWLVESKNEDPSSHSDPYAFDFSDDSPRPEPTPQDSATGRKLAGKNSNSKTLEPEPSLAAASSGASRRTVSRNPPTKKKKSDSGSSEVVMLREIDTMLKGYEEKGEPDDVGDRFSPGVAEPPRALVVGRLKKSNSEVGRGKQRLYAYTARRVPSPGEEGVALPRMKKIHSWPKRPRRGMEMVRGVWSRVGPKVGSRVVGQHDICNISGCR